MTDLLEVSKLVELRAKTDRDLVRILASTLELGIRFASPCLGSDGPLRARAERIYANAEALVPTIEDAAQRRQLQNKLAQLRELLYTETRAQAVTSTVS